MKMMALSQMMTFKIIYLSHRRLGCLLNSLFRRRSKKTSKLRVTGLCEGNPPVTGGFPSQRASNAENVSICWRHHYPRRSRWGYYSYVRWYLSVTYIRSLESQSCFTCVSAAEVRLHLLNMNVIISKCFDNSENEENNCMNAEIISPMAKLTTTSTAFSGFIWRLVANQQGSYDNCARCYMFWT